MITELIIKNFALIENITLKFNKGFNVITGETGAGKSILIDAINVLLGAPGREEYIRKGSDSTSIIGIFDISLIESPVKKILDDYDIDYTDNQIIIKRVLKQKNNKVYINNEPVTVSLLNKISSHLVDIHGQHDHQTLFDITKHLTLLDAFSSLDSELKKYKTLFNELNQIKKFFNQKEKDIQDINEKKDVYEYQLNEIKNARIIKNEDEILETKLNKIRKLSKINEYVKKIDFLVNSDNDIIYNIEKLSDYISDLSVIDKQFEKYKKNCEESLIQLNDFKDFFVDYVDTLDIDPSEIDSIESRSYKLQLIKKKYGPTLDAVISHYKNIKEKFNILLNAETDIAELKNKVKSKEEEVKLIAEKISVIRKKNAKKITKLISAELKKLNMPDAEFETKFSGTQQLTNTGIDIVEFYVRTNKGEDFKPLRKVASGGELSRFMLAVKTVFVSFDKIPVLIFDEIDTGISGKTGKAIAKSITKLAENHQVFCITHLPVLAASAFTHYKVNKKITSDRTITETKELSYDDRINEIAYLMSGGNITESSLQHAKELLSLS